VPLHSPDMVDSPYLIRPGGNLRFSRLSTDDTGDFSGKKQAIAQTRRNCARLGEFQHLLYADGRRALLVVLQGMDTAGKDGAIRRVFSDVNPQGCIVTSFKAPSSQELAQDYLWRIHRHAPARGMIGIFNRSHYESVLVERVRNLVPEKTWKRRYEHINAFEKLLADEGTVILKFFLHISKDEQKRRLNSRLKDPTKNWKFDPADLEARKRWDEYQAAYADVLEKCSTEHAPWYAVPADHKWFRDWVVSDIIVRAMEKLDLKYPPAIEGIEKLKVK
jgi:PPK2 family polyphosphate:nucleotide phosphotransferase